MESLQTIIGKKVIFNEDVENGTETDAGIITEIRMLDKSVKLMFEPHKYGPEVELTEIGNGQIHEFLNHKPTFDIYINKVQLL